MQRLESGVVGVERGSTILFSDVEHDGPMWTGRGKREVRVAVRFRERFRAPPAVFVAPDMWDFDQGTNQRADMQAERITEAGFDIVFRTWGDTRIARMRAAWMAVGDLPRADDWELY